MSGQKTLLCDSCEAVNREVEALRLDIAHSRMKLNELFSHIEDQFDGPWKKVESADYWLRRTGELISEASGSAAFDYVAVNAAEWNRVQDRLDLIDGPMTRLLEETARHVDAGHDQCSGLRIAVENIRKAMDIGDNRR